MTSRDPDTFRRSGWHHSRAGACAALAGLLLGTAGLAFAQVTFEVFPAQPVALQAVYIRVDVPDCMTLDEVSQSEGTIMVEIEWTGCFIPRPVTRPMDASLGKLPQGEYRVQVVAAYDPTRPVLGETLLVVAPTSTHPFYSGLDPLLDHSGWWTTAEPNRGEGWLIEHTLPDRLIFSWVTYDSDGNPMWLNMQTTQAEARSFVGPVYRSQRVDGEVVRTLVGQGRFLSINADSATFTLVPSDLALPPSSIELRRLRL